MISIVPHHPNKPYSSSILAIFFLIILLVDNPFFGGGGNGFVNSFSLKPSNNNNQIEAKNLDEKIVKNIGLSENENEKLLKSSSLETDNLENLKKIDLKQQEKTTSNSEQNIEQQKHQQPANVGNDENNKSNNKVVNINNNRDENMKNQPPQHQHVGDDDGGDNSMMMMMNSQLRQQMINDAINKFRNMFSIFGGAANPQLQQQSQGFAVIDVIYNRNDGDDAGSNNVIDQNEILVQINDANGNDDQQQAQQQAAHHQLSDDYHKRCLQRCHCEYHQNLRRWFNQFLSNEMDRPQLKQQQQDKNSNETSSSSSSSSSTLNRSIFDLLQLLPRWDLIFRLEESQCFKRCDEQSLFIQRIQREDFLKQISSSASNNNNNNNKWTWWAWFNEEEKTLEIIPRSLDDKSGAGANGAGSDGVNKKPCGTCCQFVHKLWRHMPLIFIIIFITFILIFIFWSLLEILYSGTVEGPNFYLKKDNSCHQNNGQQKKDPNNNNNSMNSNSNNGNQIRMILIDGGGDEKLN